MEGLQVDRVIIAHGPHEYGLPQMETHAQVLGSYLVATLIFESKAADVLVRLVWVPLRAWMIPIVVASWRQMVADLWVRTGYCCCDNSHRITHWVFCGEGNFLVG